MTVNKTGKQQQQFILKIFPLLKQEQVSIPKAVLDLGPLIFCLDVMNGSSQENKHSSKKKAKEMTIGTLKLFQIQTYIPNPHKSFAKTF